MQGCKYNCEYCGLNLLLQLFTTITLYLNESYFFLDDLS